MTAARLHQPMCGERSTEGGEQQERLMTIWATTSAPAPSAQLLSAGYGGTIAAPT
jgi:hypothetical protein